MTRPCARVLLAAIVLAPLRARAGGILLYEVGTSDVGLASAGYGARAQDASTVLTNPAGMTRLAGAQILVGGQLLYADATFTPGAGTSPGLGSGNGGNPIGWFPGGGLFFSYALSPQVAVGIATAGTFGTKLGYEPGWVGRYYAQEATLIGLSLLPSVAWKPIDQLSLGASLNAMYGVLEQKMATNGRGGADGQLSFSDTAWGVGVNVGVLWEPAPGTRIGVTWNSQVSLGFSAVPELTGATPQQSLSIGMRVPQGVMVSALQQVGDRFAVLAGAGWQQWSKFGMLEVGLSDTASPATFDLHYKDTWHGALGAQFWLTPAWRIDGGVAYDSEFQDGSDVSPIMPVNAAWRFGLGFRHQGEKLGWGAAAEYGTGPSLGVNRQATLPLALGGRGDLAGSYSPFTLFLAVNVDWKL
ncbi:MAG TPA: outer membrane protein transport protein [Terriglobales bacterium]|nr:outer membrane protein transport protein [Terriglobales bacterium]